MIISRGKPVTFSDAPNGTYPAYPIDLMETGDADWVDDASSLPTSGAKIHQLESSFTVGSVGWSGSSGNLRSITIDLESALHADFAILKGYYGTDSITRPLSILLEYSDNGSTWTTSTDLTSLSAGGAPGAKQWWVKFDTSASDHRYWRATLELGGAWLFVSTFELYNTWNNVAEGRSYTTGTVDGNFPNNYMVDTIHPGETDFTSSGAGKLTNGEHGWPGSFGTGVGYQVGNLPASTRIDLGSAMGGDHVAVWGINGSGTSMRSPSAVTIEYSDNDADWTSVLTKTGLTQAFSAKGIWVARADISAAGDHRYWRVTVDSDVIGSFVTLTQFELWQELGGGAVEVAVGQAVEAESANPISPLISREVLVGQAVEVEVARAIAASVARQVDVGTATESELARAITPLVGRNVLLGTATEVELARAIVPILDRTINVGTATERELARAIAAVKPIFVDLGTAVEVELGLVITPHKTSGGMVESVECVLLYPSAVCAVLHGTATCTTLSGSAVGRVLL